MYQKALIERALEGKHNQRDVEKTIQLLNEINLVRPEVIRDETPYHIVDAKSFHARNDQIIAASDELVAFRVANSRGTTYTIDRARATGIDVTVFDY